MVMRCNISDLLKLEPTVSTTADLRVQSRRSDIREEADPILCLQRVELLLEGLGFEMQRLGNLPPVLSRRLASGFGSIAAVIVRGICWDAHTFLGVRPDTNLSYVASLASSNSFNSRPSEDWLQDLQ